MQRGHAAARPLPVLNEPGWHCWHEEICGVVEKVPTAQRRQLCSEGEPWACV